MPLELRPSAYRDKERYTADDLVAIIAILRDPEHGCPWDRVQTHASVRANFLEEAYEVADAIDLDDPGLMCEELGDVLMQVVFHACIEEQAGRFDWQQVCDGVCRKLVYRHPHIFGPQPGAEGINDWDALKNKEKGRANMQEDLASVPHALPALSRAAKLQKRAAHYGVAVPAPSPESVAEQVRRIRAGDTDGEAALGQLLFAITALARQDGLDPEQALSRQADRFERDPQTTPTA